MKALADEAEDRMMAGVSTSPDPGQIFVQGEKDGHGILIHKTHPLHPDFDKNIKRLDEHATKTATSSSLTLRRIEPPFRANNKSSAPVDSLHAPL